MIPGTAITGVLRHALLDNLEDGPKQENSWNSVFGYQEKKQGLGSRLLISAAYLMLNESTMAEGIIEIDEKLKVKFDNLPSRQHVRIDHRGVAEKRGLFDNEVVYKGARFKFEIELIGEQNDETAWDNIIKNFQSPFFRLGQGTRNGYGELSVKTLKSKIFDLTKEDDFIKYTDFDGSLNNDTCLDGHNLSDPEDHLNLIRYSLELTPDSYFFIFSEGFGDEEVDNKPLEEEVVTYTNGSIEFICKTVIPASSIKGALAHRTAFHYNKLKERYSDELFGPLGKENAIALYTGSGNKAVNELFGLGSGFEWNNNVRERIKIMPPQEYDSYGEARRGRVVIDDLYYSEVEVQNNKIFNHVAIDRFTGGAMEGALFSEKVSHLLDGENIVLKICVENIEDEEIMNAFENALLDITRGLLPLGGMTTKGMGIFTGTLLKNKLEINTYHTNKKQNAE